MTDPTVGLTEAIQALREQLSLARLGGWYNQVGFRVEPVELTIQAVVSKDGNGKIGWGVISVGGEYKSSTTQTLKLTLTPVLKLPDGTVTTDFTIASEPSDQRPNYGS